jgi:hypothetical protein
VNLGATIPNGGTVYLLWADQNSSGTDASYHIDNFAVTGVIPEPSAVAFGLLASGMAISGRRRRR